MSFRTLLACGLLLFATSALAQPSTADLSAYRDAGSRFVELFSAAEAANDSAPLKTAEAATLIEKISDEKRMLSGVYTVDDREKIAEICSVAMLTSVSLILFETRDRFDPENPPREVGRILASWASVENPQFQDELQELLPFVARCLAKELPLTDQFAASLSADEMSFVRRFSFVFERFRALQIFFGILNIYDETADKAEFRLALISALAETAREFASVTPLPLRKEMVQATIDSAPKVPTRYKAPMERIAAAFKDETCGTLCSLEPGSPEGD